MRSFRSHLVRMVLSGCFLSGCLASSSTAWAETPDETPNSSAETSKRSRSATREEGSIYLRFVGRTWDDVMASVAKDAGKTLVMPDVPTGRLSRYDHTGHTLEAAVRILNHELDSTGYKIMMRGEYLLVLRTMIASAQNIQDVFCPRTKPREPFLLRLKPPAPRFRQTGRKILPPLLACSTLLASYRKNHTLYSKNSLNHFRPNLSLLLALQPKNQIAKRPATKSPNSLNPIISVLWNCLGKSSVLMANKPS